MKKTLGTFRKQGDCVTIRQCLYLSNSEHRLVIQVGGSSILAGLHAV